MNEKNALQEKWEMPEVLKNIMEARKVNELAWALLKYITRNKSCIKNAKQMFWV